ncbi:hypothetical protein Leryth_024354 [Lithospermum erythrorhizon]|nr:hypothetical protein Leryth_024354 [Lithospermum erythrorhizon]
MLPSIHHNATPGSLPPHPLSTHPHPTLPPSSYPSLHLTIIPTPTPLLTTPVDQKPPPPPHCFLLPLLKTRNVIFSAENRPGKAGSGRFHSRRARVFITNSLASRFDSPICPYAVSARGSLQDALLHKKCVELMSWDKRFRIISQWRRGSSICIIFAIRVLFTEILSRLMCCWMGISMRGLLILGWLRGVGDLDSDVVEPSPSERLDKSSVLDKSSISEGVCDVISTDSGYYKKGIGRRKSESGRDWWWKQEIVNAGSESGRIKDYVMEG